jgi:hypothetical protein
MPLTEEEIAAKSCVIKNLLIKKWVTQKEAKKVNQVKQEKGRHIIMGKEMLKTKEQMDHENANKILDAKQE